MQQASTSCGSYRRYLLFLLVIILAFHFVDRAALGLVLQNIKTDLRLSDLELGFLSGISFALFYAVMGLPIAHWADRGDRAVIISLATALGAVMIALCGRAASFAQLLLIRVGVGVGEAGCIPPAHSLLADYFDRAERPRAAAIYALGGPISFVLGFFLAGWLNELYGWRAMFIMLGLPGLALAALAAFTLREPRRAHFGKYLDAATTQLGFWKVCRTLWLNITFRRLLLAYSGMYFFGYGILQWQPTFFIRSYGLSSGEVGTWFALIYGVGGAAGTYLGGAWASRYAARNERLQLQGLAVAMVVYGTLSGLVYLCSTQYAAFAVMAVSNVAGYALYGPLFATIQTLVPERMRAMSIALVNFSANLLGLGLGPLLTGAVSDAMSHWAGTESLRYALLTLVPGFFLVGWSLWSASRSIVQDLVGNEALA